MSVDAIVRTLLREGTTLYPYRPSALKNRYRFAFGCCFPRTWAAAHPDDRARVDACVLLQAPAQAEVIAELRFLQPTSSDTDPIERTVEVARGAVASIQGAIEIAFEPLLAHATAHAELVQDDLWRIAISVHNVSRLAPSVTRDEALPATLASTHVVLRTSHGRFVSVQDPPEALAEHARACHGPPLWPFLAAPDDTAIVCSPIIVDDHAAIAPESPGDFFDGTEIDEMLTLRVLTMTDAEAHEAAEASPEIRTLIERCRRLSPQARARLWGAVTGASRRSFAGPRALQPGDRVRLHPSVRADAMDTLLRGREATITGSETDFEGRCWLTVVIDGDPGADLGRAGLPGHRFFFAEEEVELL
jgi:hypothetical protein